MCTNNMNFLFTFLLALYLIPAWSEQALCGHETYGFNAVYDLANGATCNDSPYITEHVSFSGTGCSRRGVLKLTFDNASRKKAVIDLYLTNATGWVFNLGDSRTNNGWAGDASTSIYDAEIQGLGTTLTGYKNDVGGSGQSFTASNAYSSKLTLVVEDGQVLWVSDTSANVVVDPHLYVIDGTGDNYDLYLGLNRVVYGSYRLGSGVCKAAIKFLS